MNSWRDDASPETRDRLDGLLDAALRAGREQLDHAGEFFPFAVTVDQAGDTDLVQPELPASRDVGEVHERCWQALAERAGGHRGRRRRRDRGRAPGPGDRPL